MKNILGSILIVGCVILCSAPASAEQSPRPSQSQTFSSEEYHIGFAYPGNWIHRPGRTPTIPASFEFVTKSGRPANLIIFAMDLERPHAVQRVSVNSRTLPLRGEEPLTEDFATDCSHEQGTLVERCSASFSFVSSLLRSRGLEFTLRVELGERSIENAISLDESALRNAYAAEIAAVRKVIRSVESSSL